MRWIFLILTNITALKALSDLSLKGKEKTKGATEFTLSEAINTFGLKFEKSVSEFSTFGILKMKSG